MSERIVLAGLLGLALAACTDEPAPAETSTADADAQGEVQGGTISDAMLPLDEVRSKSPPLAGEDRGGNSGDGDGDGANTDVAGPETGDGTNSVAAPGGDAAADTADQTAE